MVPWALYLIIIFRHLVKYTLPTGCKVCGVERDDGVTANDDYDPTIVGEDSKDVDKVRLQWISNLR